MQQKYNMDNMNKVNINPILEFPYCLIPPNETEEQKKKCKAECADTIAKKQAEVWKEWADKNVMSGLSRRSWKSRLSSRRTRRS